MLSLLQEQGECNLWNYAQCAFCGRATLPVAQALQGPHESVFEIVVDPQSSYSHIPSPDSIVVSPIPKSAFSIWAASVPTWMNSLYACTWCPTNTNSCLRKPSKRPVSAPTSMLLSISHTVDFHAHQQILTSPTLQISRQSRRQRRFPSPCPRSPLPCCPHQQDVVVCRGR